jgi:PST family polysaccharide transporter
MPEAPSGSAHAAHAAERLDLDRALLSGLAWTGAARWSAQALTWATTIFLARLLTPEDYGIWTSAAVYVGIVALLSEFGIGASVVMLRDLTRQQIAQINGLAVLAGFGAMALSLVLASPIAAFYRTPVVAPLISAISIVFVISAFRIVPVAILQRDLHFRFLALADLVRSIVMSVVLIAFALAGFGFWIFPIGVLAGEVVWTGLALVARRHPISWPRLGRIRHAIQFSSDIVLSRLSWYGYSNADFLIAGRLLGPTALGSYGMAWNMASVPVDKINSIIMGVTPAVFSAVQDRKVELRRYVTALTGSISMLAFPAGLGLALVADDFVRVVLGPEWTAAVGPIRVLAIYATVRSLTPILTPVLNAVGETRFALWNNVLALVLLPMAFLAGSRWGIVGIAAGWAIGHPLIMVRLYRRVAERTELRAREYFNAVLPALRAATIMVAAVLLLKLFTQGLPPAIRLPLYVAVGACTYGGVVWLFDRERVRAIWRAVRKARA